MIGLLTSLLLAQAGSATATCQASKAACDPWAAYRVTTPPPEEFYPGPYLLIVTLKGGVTKIRYKTGRACGKARDAIEGKKQASTPSQLSLPTVRIAFCVPLNP